MYLVKFKLTSLFFYLFVLMFGHGSAHGWTEFENCEGVEDVKVPGFFSLTKYTSEKVKAGSTSCRMGISSGTDGWGTWGGTMAFPSDLAKGDELWIRLNMFVPTDFNYTGSPQLKFMRVHTKTSSGGHLGYLDFLVTPNGPTHWDSNIGIQSDAPYYYYYESVVRQIYPGTYQNDRIQKGVWESFEIYWELDNVSVDSGGNGRVRIWKNNKLLGDYTNQTTLTNSTDLADSFFLFTYWNGNAPKTQHVYIDDIVMTSDRPDNVDAHGNYFIGGENSDPAPEYSRPSPPSEMQISLPIK